MKKQLLILTTALLSINAFAQVPSYVPSNGLVAFYPFDGNGNDLSSGANNLIPNGNISYTQNMDGLNNSACHFPNGNDYFFTPSSSWSLINNYPQGSVSFWVKVDSMYVSNHYFGIGNSFIIKQKHGVGEDLFFGLQDGTTRVRMQISGVFPSPQGADVIGSTSLTPNIWYHIVGIWDGTNHTLYVNGVQDGQISNTSGMSDRPLPDYFSIGSILYGGNGSTTFPSGAYGSMDEIGIWNRALTQNEITALYNACNISITTQPSNQSMLASIGSVQFSVSSTATSPTYQWQTDLGLGFQNLNNAGQYSGVQTNALNVANITMTNNNQQFRCIVNDGSCVDTSAIAVLTVIDDLGIESLNPSSFKKLIQITDLSGKETPFRKNTVLLFIYEDGTVERVYVTE